MYPAQIALPSSDLLEDVVEVCGTATGVSNGTDVEVGTVVLEVIGEGTNCSLMLDTALAMLDSFSLYHELAALAIDFGIDADTVSVFSFVVVSKVVIVH